MRGAGSLIFWVLTGLWIAYVFMTVPEAPNPYPKSSRWWLLQKLVGGKRGRMMMIGIIALGILYGLVVL